MKFVISLFICLLACFNGQAQPYVSSFDKEISKAIQKLQCPMPDEEEPVTLNAVLVKGKNSSEITVVIKLRTAQGWHVYAYVPPEQPFIVTECLLNPPEGVSAAGEWIKSSPQASLTDKGVLTWEGEAAFVRKVKVGKGSKGIIEAGLYYQTCNNRMCLPPTEKLIKLEM